MKNRFLSLLCVLALCLSLLPVTALAADGGTVYVGGEMLSGSTDSPAYATTDDNGTVTIVDASADKYNIKWDGSTLTLDGAKIKGGTSSESLYATVGIYAFSNSGDVSLNIALKGVNEIFESSDGIWVYSSSYNAGAVTLTIEGEGSLNASGSSSGILVQSNNGNATLTIQNAEVTATSTVGVGVQVRSGAQKSASLTVDGGSLTATGMSEYGAGIRYTFGSSSFGSGKPSLTVSGNTIVRANGGIANNSSTSIQYGTGNEENGGIVFDGNEGTVYGSVTLQENLEIGEGESLTIPEDSSLDMGGHTITVENGGKLEGSPIGNGTVKIAPTITTTESLPDGEVGTVYSQTLTATGDPTITWNVTSGTLPAGLTLDTNTGTISGTPTTANTYSFTVTATNASGSDSKEYTIQIAAKSDTTPPTLTAGTVNRSSDKDATVTFNSNEAGTYFYNVVDSGASEPTDITSGTSYNLNSDTNTITLTDLTAGAKDIYIVAKDNANNESTALTMGIPAYVEPVYSISADTTPLDFGSVYTGYIQPAAQTVTITNTGNQQVTVTLPTANDFIITAGTGFTNGSAAIEPDGTATFTVQPKAGLAVGTYSENITVSGSEGATVTIPASFTVEQRDNTPYYGITVNDLANGTVTCYAKSAAKGAEVTLTVKPDVGYALDKLTVTDASGKTVDVTKVDEKTYTFVMPACAVTVEAVFAPITSDLPFTDVSTSDWFYGAVKFVYENGLMDGVGNNLFAPNATLNRAMAVTILYRLEGAPAVTTDAGFNDVAAGTWYTDAVNWAAANNIVNGVEGNNFDPTGSLTREQMATVLYRYAQYKGADVSASGDISGFADSANVSSWAVDAVKWAVGSGLINGVEGNALAPQGTSTRAQAATVLMRFVG